MFFYEDCHPLCYGCRKLKFGPEIMMEFSKDILGIEYFVGADRALNYVVTIPIAQESSN